MQNTFELKQNIRHLAETLREPVNYISGGIGKAPDEPNNILLLRRDPGQKIDRATDAGKLYHRRYVLTVNLATDGLVCINEKTFPIPEDYAALVYPYQSHHYLVDQNNFFWLVITFELHQPNLVPEMMYRSNMLELWQYRLLERVLILYLQLQETPDDAAELLLQRTFGNLLLELSTATDRIDADHHLPADNSRVRLFEEINGFIYQKLDDPTLSVEEIAEKHYISASYLYLVFNNMAGCNPGEYIRNLRIKQALKLLDTQELLVSEVADRTGFSSLPIFSRCFRRVVGMSPSSYLQQKNRKKP